MLLLPVRIAGMKHRTNSVQAPYIKKALCHIQHHRGCRLWGHPRAPFGCREQCEKQMSILPLKTADMLFGLLFLLRTAAKRNTSINKKYPLLEIKHFSSVSFTASSFSNPYLKKMLTLTAYFPNLVPREFPLREVSGTTHTVTPESIFNTQPTPEDSQPVPPHCAYKRLPSVHCATELFSSSDNR